MKEKRDAAIEAQEAPAKPTENVIAAIFDSIAVP